MKNDFADVTPTLILTDIYFAASKSLIFPLVAFALCRTSQKTERVLVITKHICSITPDDIDKTDHLTRIARNE